MGLAETYRALGKRAEAIQYYEKYLETSPQGSDVEAARSALANRAAVIVALNASGRLHIYGYAPLGTEPTAGEARFATKLKYRFGFGPA